MFTHEWFYFLKVLAHFRPKQLVDFFTYNTQIVCLIDAIISKAHDNGKYNYVQDCEGLRPLTEYTFFCRFMQNYINWWYADEFSHFHLKILWWRSDADPYRSDLWKTLELNISRLAPFKDQRNYNETFLLEEQKSDEMFMHWGLSKSFVAFI